VTIGDLMDRDEWGWGTLDDRLVDRERLLEDLGG